MSKSQEYLEYLFSDKLIFEKEVLHVKSDEDRKDIMSILSRDLCNDRNLASKVNFLKIKSIDDLNFKGVNISLVQIFLAELLSLLEEKHYTRAEIESVKKSKIYLKFLYELAQTYMRRFSSAFYKEVVNTFFDLISIADKANQLSPLVLEVINGTQNTKSLLQQSGSGKILHKSEQAWMRVKQARDEKNRKVKVFQVEIVNLVHRIDQLKLHISAIVAAKSLSIDELKKITPKLLLDMFTEEDDVQLHTKKTMFSYVPAGEMADILMHTAQKASSLSKTNSEKEDYRKISEFFKKCRNTNTQAFINARFEEFKHELEIKSKRYREQRLKLKTVRDRPLDSFDITLKKIKEAMVFNLQTL